MAEQVKKSQSTHWVLFLIIGVLIFAIFLTVRSDSSIPIVITFAGLLYFLPTLAAVAKRNHNQTSILLLNFLAGWSFVGWVIALVWAFKKRGIQMVQQVPPEGGSFCSQCGAALSPETKFCVNCGAKRG